VQLHQLKKISSFQRKKRVGRGRSSGKGKTCGRGTKGQKSRSGSRKLPAFFEGGRMPLVQRLPKKRGFKRLHKKYTEIVNIEKLNLFKNNSEIDKKLLFKKNLIKSPSSIVKILGDGQISKKLFVKVDQFSISACEKIKKAGGKTTKLETKRYVK